MRPRLPRTTFGLAAAVSVVLSALAILAGLIGQHFAHEELEAQLNHRIAAESSLLVAEFERSGLEGLAGAVNARHERHEASGLGYALVGPDGRRIAGSLMADIPTKLGWEEFLYVDRGAHAERSAFQALTVQLPSGERLVVAADRRPINETDGIIGWLTAGTTTVMLLFGLGGAWILSLITRRRIDNVSKVALAITEGEFDRRISSDDRAGEFERLAITLNRMLDRNAELFANLQQVSTDIAHDLITPLNQQQQQLELALSEGVTAEDYRAAIENAIVAAREIQQLFAAMLKISEIESLSLREDFAPVSLTEISARVAEAFRPDVEQGNRTLISSIEPSINVVGERHLLSQLLVNLIENAMMHTPSGTTINVSLRCRANQALLVVKDNGPGVEAADLQRITERFVRLEGSRSTPGHGLGLSLVKAIANAHGATLSLENAAPGLKICVIFTLASDRS